jgi:3-phosphoshikimate 1-carboxyvinyltransferase
MTPEAHDEMVARTSHLPHMVASLLVTAAARGGVDEPFRSLCGAGFRDTTRIAGGSPEMWHDIVKTNREAILSALRQYQGDLGELIAAMEGGDFDAVAGQLDRGRRLREDVMGVVNDGM